MRAHGELDLQIAEVTQRIRRSPLDATLHLRRAELLRLHGEPEPALADIAEARRLDPKLVELDFSEGRALIDLERWAEARSALDRFLANRPDHPIALWYRAQTLVKLDQRLLADTDFRRCFELAPNPTPELVLARAANLGNAGELEPALAALEEGIKRLGRITSLELAAVEVEVKLERIAAALKRLDELVAGAARTEALLIRKGGILAETGQVDAARECYLAARAQLESLPGTLRSTQSNRALAGEISMGLEKLTPAADERTRESR